MPPKVTKATSLKIHNDPEIDSWVRRESEIRGISKSEYISMLLKVHYEGKGYSLQKRAGTETELCTLLYNNLQALYFLRKHINEKSQSEISSIFKEALKVVARAKDYLDSRNAGIDRLELENILDCLRECRSAMEIVRQKMQNTELDKMLVNVINSCQNFLEAHS